MNQIATGYFLDFNFIINDIAIHPIIPTNLLCCHEFCNSLILITGLQCEKKRVGIPYVTNGPFGLRGREGSSVEQSRFSTKLAYFSLHYSTLLHSHSFPPPSKQAIKILEVLGWSISLLNLWTTLRQACQSIKLKQKSHSHSCHLNKRTDLHIYCNGILITLSALMPIGNTIAKEAQQIQRAWVRS